MIQFAPAEVPLAIRSSKRLSTSHWLRAEEEDREPKEEERLRWTQPFYKTIRACVSDRISEMGGIRCRNRRA